MGDRYKFMNPPNRPMQMQQITAEHQQMMIRTRQLENQRLMATRPPQQRNRYPSQITPQQHNQAMAKMRLQQQQLPQQQQQQQSQQQQQPQQPQQQQQQQMYYQPQRIMNSSTMRAPMAVHAGHGRQEGMGHPQMVSISSDMNVQYITASPQMAGAQGMPVPYNTVRQVPFSQGPGGSQQNMGPRPVVYQVKGALPHGVRAEIPSNSIIFGGTSGSGDTVLIQNSQMVPGPSTAPNRPQARALRMALSSQPQQMTSQAVPIEAVPVTVSVADPNAPGPSATIIRVQSPAKKVTPPPQPVSSDKPTPTRPTKKSNSKSKSKANVAPPAAKQPEPAPLPAKATKLIDRQEIERIVKEMGLEGKIDVIPYKLVMEYAETYAQLAADDLTCLAKGKRFAPEERPVIKERDANFVVKKLKARYSHV
uniref:Histone-fold-containing protein n=1 Tax=Panagrellus redivivus TaxID=6233 RepID=A0A7E4V7C6_PANRE